MSRKAQASELEVQNAIKTLLANIRFASVDDPIRSLVLTSSIPNEGKSTISIYLAQAIASSGKTVLLVECDMRRRALAGEMGLHASAGIYSVLSDQVALQQAVIGTGQANMYFLDCEPRIPNPADILSSKRFKRLTVQLEEQYDFVIYDTPPVGTFVDAALLSTMVDGTILVVREEFTKRAEIQMAYDQLKKAEANVIGVVMNYCKAQSSEYYYAYYNKDGKRVKKSSSSGKSSYASSGSMGLSGAAGASSATVSAPVSVPASSLPASGRVGAVKPSVPVGSSRTNDPRSNDPRRKAQRR